MIIIVEIESHFHVVFVWRGEQAHLSDCVVESQDTDFVEFLSLIDGQDEKPVEPKSHFFDTDSEARLEASDSRGTIHVKCKRIVLSFPWYVAEKIKAPEYVVKVLSTKVLFVTEQLPNLIKLEAVLLLIFWRRVCICLTTLLGIVQISSISTKRLPICSFLSWSLCFDLE